MNHCRPKTSRTFTKQMSTFMVRKNRSAFYPLVRSYGPQVSGPRFWSASPHFTHATPTMLTSLWQRVQKANVSPNADFVSFLLHIWTHLYIRLCTFVRILSFIRFRCHFEHTTLCRVGIDLYRTVIANCAVAAGVIERKRHCAEYCADTCAIC